MPENRFSFELARPVEKDARLVMQWRNNPETLRMFYHPEPKIWDSFYPEYLSTYFSHPNLPPVFVLKDGQRIAFLRFLPIPSEKGRLRSACDISINVDPELRGQGLGTAILKSVKAFLVRQGIDDLFAEVRKENESSQKAFQKADFHSLGESEIIIEDTKERCRIHRYRAELTKPFLGEDSVFVIAEAGSNWRMGTAKRDLAMAKSLIDVAAASGADAVKFQTYRPETTYVEDAGQSEYLSENGITEDILDIFADLAMPYEMIPELATYCDAQSIAFMSTPFSAQDFAAVNPYVAVHKIASYEISHQRLLEAAGKSGKPLIISTGAACEDDIAWAIETFQQAGGNQLCLMQCTAKYPASSGVMNLRVIPWMKSRFGVCAGLSDHSRNPLYAPLAAVGLGARIIEKHFTLDNRLPGPDHSFAVLPEELSEMVRAIREAEQMLGSGVKTVLDAENELHSFARRGLQALTDIKKGDIFGEGISFDILRPGQRKAGLHPRHLKNIQGKSAARDIPKGDGINFGDWIE